MRDAIKALSERFADRNEKLVLHEPEDVVTRNRRVTAVSAHLKAGATITVPQLARAALDVYNARHSHAVALFVWDHPEFVGQVPWNVARVQLCGDGNKWHNGRWMVGTDVEAADYATDYVVVELAKCPFCGRPLPHGH